MKKMKEAYEKQVAEKSAEIERLKTLAQQKPEEIKQDDLENIDVSEFFTGSLCILSNEERKYLRSLIKK